jgi:beta-N-acetylhexosaminidase
MLRKSLLLIAIAAACRTSAPKIPDAPASIAGRVTSVQLGNGIGTVRIEARPEDTAGSAKAVVRITEATAVIGAPASGTADFTAIRSGQWVRVWFVGPVRESYPVQANAGTIVIDSAGVQP